MFVKALPIWLETQREDSYVEFIDSFRVQENERVILRISCDSVFCAKLNGEIVAFSACSDYPDKKRYDEFDLTKCCQAENRLEILVWYMGVGNFSYAAGEAFVAYEIEQEGKILAYSHENTLSKLNERYDNGRKQIYTDMMGYTFCYDNAKAEREPYRKSTVKKLNTQFSLRNIGAMRMLDRREVKITPNAEGYLVDLGEETVGFLELDFKDEISQPIRIGFAERLTEGKVKYDLSLPNSISTYKFCADFISRAGENTYINGVRRFAGRYLQLFCQKTMTVNFVGLRGVERAEQAKEKHIKDKTLQKIYDISVNTLKLCMHEHYEDCPWREQALYALDAKNQMLCGYKIFENTQFQRENLLLISQGLMDDGLLSLCFPMDINMEIHYPIPVYSLVFPLQVRDYIQHTQDMSILSEVKDCIYTVMQTFANKIEENGLIADFGDGYWNFYDWSINYLLGSDTAKKRYNLLLNCFYVYACEACNELYGMQIDTKPLKKAIVEHFYNPEKNMFRVNVGEETYSCFGNSMAVLIGLGNADLLEKLKDGDGQIEITLPTTSFYYDALLTAGDTYKAFIIQDIKKKYQPMLDFGATTFWEIANLDQLGETGSMCHGWSALPAYYFWIIDIDKYM